MQLRVMPQEKQIKYSYMYSYWQISQAIVLSKKSYWQKKQCSMKPDMAGRWKLCKYICDLQLSLYMH